MGLRRSVFRVQARELMAARELATDKYQCAFLHSLRVSMTWVCIQTQEEAFGQFGSGWKGPVS